jgi:hypothetical protein
VFYEQSSDFTSVGGESYVLVTVWVAVLAIVTVAKNEFENSN